MAEEITQEKQAATTPDVPVAAPEDNLPGKLVSVIESGGTGQKDPSTITGVVRYDIAPQVQGGNQMITDALTAVLSQYDPVLGPNITESLKYPDTTEAGLSALATNFSPQQQVGVLNSLAPYTTNAEHYAHRDPTVEYDVSLLNRPAMMQVAQQQQQTMNAAAQLKQQGELATGDAMQYLASQGIANTSAAIAVADQMRDGLKHMNDAQVHLQQRGNVLGTIVQIPTTPVPIMQGAGPVDQQGVWHPVLNGYAMSTPARQQMMETLQRPDVKQYFQQNGITGVDPQFTSTAEPNVAVRPPTQAQTRQNTPTWDQIQADPRFAQLPPDRQLAMKKAYFDKFAALAPPLQNAIRQNPNLYGPLQNHFIGPQQPMGPQPQAPSLSQQMDQAMTGLLGSGRLGAPLREMVGDVAGLAEKGLAGVKGMTAGFLPPKLEKKLGDLAGQHPIVEELSRAGSNMIAGGPIIGPVITETARSLVGSGYQGMPAFTNMTDLIEQSIPLSPYQPTSIAAAGTRALLGAQLLNKAVEYAGPAYRYLSRTKPGQLVSQAAGAVLKPVGSLALKGVVGAAKGVAGTARLAATGVSKITPELMKRIVRNLIAKGSWSGNELTLLEKAAAAQNLPVNMWINLQIQQDMPLLRVMEAGKGTKLEIILHNDKIITDVRQYNKAFADEMDKVIKNPKYLPTLGDRTTFMNVRELKGTPAQLNSFLVTNGRKEIQVETAYAIKGVKMRQVGNEVHVYDGGYPLQKFTGKDIQEALEKAGEYVDSLPVNPASVTDALAKRVAAEGDNFYYIVSRVPAGSKIVKQWEGDLPDHPHWGELIRKGLRYIQLPKENFIRLEQNTGIKFYSKMWLQMEDALRAHKVFSAPYIADMEKILGQQHAWKELAARKSTAAEAKRQSQGYIHLLETSPGTQAWDQVVKHFNLDESKGKAIRDWFVDLLPKFGIDPHEFFTELMPQIQKSGLNAYIPRANVPKSVTFFLDQIKTGDFPLNMRELDIRTLMERTINEGSWNLHVKDAWDNAWRMAKRNKVIMNQSAKNSIDTYLRAIKGWGPAIDKEIMELIGQGAARLLGRTGEIPGQDAAKLGRQLYAEGYGANAGSYFAWRPATVVRQFFQTFQTVYPRFGERATFEGMKRNFAPGAEKILQDAGIFTEFGKEAGVSMRGTAAVEAADRWQRGFGAFAQEYLFERRVSEYVAGKIPWQVFAKDAKLNLFQPAEQDVLRGMIDAGETLKAKQLAMRTAMVHTNFDYAFQARAPFMTGNFFGRLFGQFGVFPVAYGEYLLEGFSRGSLFDKIAWLTRWSAANLVLQETFKYGLGADASNWLWHHPVWFQGGPTAGYLHQVGESIFDPSERSPGLLETGAGLATATVRGKMAMKDVGKAALDVGGGDIQGAARDLLSGMPPTKEQKKAQAQKRGPWGGPTGQFGGRNWAR